MIVYRISDGLGNQLFQYVAARVLCLLNNHSELYLDAQSFSDQRCLTEGAVAREYKLNSFMIAISGLVASVDLYDLDKRTVAVTFPLNSTEGLNQPIKITLPYFSSPLFWDARILTIRGDAYVSSFAQNWRHFIQFEETIRAELQFREQPDERNQSTLRAIASQPSVSVHVRRTDYLQAGYQTCQLEYYERAMSYMRGMLPGVRFFVFSDDFEWVIEQWRSKEDVQFVTHNGERGCEEDLRLMAACTGNIIANSTFSWWGAWLNNNPQKIVIAPHTWKRSSESSDPFILPGWIRM